MNTVHNCTEKSYSGFEDIPVRMETPRIDPREAGFNPGKLDTLDRHFLGLIKSGALQSASYLLARRGEIFACRAMGALHYGEGGLYQTDSIRWIASITKLFTTIAAVQLYERGLLDLFAPVAEHLTEFDTPMHKKIWPSHLLTHTSGLRADGGYFCEPYMHGWNENLNNWIEEYLAGPVQSKPGEQWSYSTLGFAVVGELITRISGMDVTGYINEHILKPLKMKDSGFSVPKEKLGRVCLTCEWEEKRVAASTQPRREGAPPSAGGGMYSTMHDMYRLGQCLLDDGTLEGARILSRKSIEFMKSNQLHDVPAFHWGGDVKDFRYGLGLVIKKDDFATWNTFGHEGAGFSGLYADKDNDLVYVFFVPSDRGWTAESVDNPRAIVWSGLEGPGH